MSITNQNAIEGLTEAERRMLLTYLDAYDSDEHTNEGELYDVVKRIVVDRVRQAHEDGFGQGFEAGWADHEARGGKA